MASFGFTMLVVPAAGPRVAAQKKARPEGRADALRP
jgi:hypothetical protein